MPAIGPCVQCAGTVVGDTVISSLGSFVGVGDGGRDGGNVCGTPEGSDVVGTTVGVADGSSVGSAVTGAPVGSLVSRSREGS